MQTIAESNTAMLDPEPRQKRPVGTPPAYQVQWTGTQRLLRFLSKPLAWLRGRIYRRFLQWNAPALAFWIAEMPILFSIVSVLVELRIFDRLRDEAKRAKELANEAGADEEGLLRIVRAAAALGLLKRHKNETYSLRPLGRQFLSDSPNPVCLWVELLDRALVSAMPRMTDAVVMGKSLSQALSSQRPHGMKQDSLGMLCGGRLSEVVRNRSCWEMMDELPGTIELHDKACGTWSAIWAEPIAKGYDFSNVRTVIDVGGGQGVFLTAMLNEAPHLRGQIYDREPARAAAEAYFVKHGVADRASYVCGNFFESVPAGADLYTIKHVLHDWDDERVVAILRRIREAVPAHGKLLIVEGSVDHGLLPSPAVLAVWDVSQVAGTLGKCRTLEQFSQVTFQAGFHLKNVYVPKTIDALILECVPVEPVE